MTQIVVTDIGGTHARFALAEVASGRVTGLGPETTLRVADHEGFEDAWRAYAAMAGEPLPRGAGIALAGPIVGDSIKLTNSPWIIRPATLAAQLGLDAHILINDFGAVGHAVAQAGESQFVHLCGPEQPLPAKGIISVIGPGTGLGVAHLWRDGEDYHVGSTEGAHIGFSPLDAVEDALFDLFRKRHGRVSVERVVAGPGLVDICAVLAEIEGKTFEYSDDKSLWERGMSGADPLVADAIERFCLALGTAAGDFALAHGASAMVIAGGLGLRLKDRLKASGFADRFIAKGRYEGMMRGIPVKLITHPQPGLFGAAAAFAKEHAA